MSRSSIEEQIAEVEREIQMRRRVYGRNVEQGKMSQRKADEQLGLMEDVLDTLRGVAQT